ncbi:hypothetical protein N7450_007162 [Penicillium hetheringtonii]|uniref:Scytalone dehydratase-like domain-containing protein n=1 Tax=Penicillium hetheringtonii TaxID=911720 RepID=A0AAD6DH45_9EURO|nr:hypothetical protein N7450_007162 [Penicillium hetheringtonii]
MSSEDFIAMMSSPGLLGNPLILTQHLIGAASYECISEDEISATYQIRAAHQSYTDSSLEVVAHRGHGHGNVKHWYKRVDGVWKLAGVRPEMYWVEHELSKIFTRPGNKV